MTIYIADIEADGLRPTKIHCISVKNYKTKERFHFTDMGDFEDWWAPQDHLHITWVFHNGLAYDVPNINKLTNVVISEDKVIDTMVVSKLRNYKQYKTHSLDEIGGSLGFPKTKYTGGWDVYTKEMGDYCDDDVDVTETIFEDQYAFIFAPENAMCLRTEHDSAKFCYEMHKNGFPFDKKAAEEMLAEIRHEMGLLETDFRKLTAGRRLEDRRIKVRYKKDGTLMKKVAETIVENPDAGLSEDGSEIIIYKDWDFNPGSSKQCIDLLNEYGWKPIDMTTGHKKHLREKRQR
jgi:hypothetical protein